MNTDMGAQKKTCVQHLHTHKSTDHQKKIQIASKSSDKNKKVEIVRVRAGVHFSFFGRKCACLLVCVLRSEQTVMNACVRARVNSCMHTYVSQCAFWCARECERETEIERGFE